MKTYPANFMDCEQTMDDPRWREFRRGCVTASKVAHAISKLQRASNGRKAGESSAMRDACALEMAYEILNTKGLTSEKYVSYWMERGQDFEPLARAAYEIERGVNVDRVGFVTHLTIARAGMSPDGIILDQGGIVELKVPKTQTHLRYRLEGVIPEEYRPQMLWQLACAGPDFHWNDFCSYSPDLPPEMQTFIIRMERNAQVEAEIAAMEQEILQFLAEVDLLVAKLKG